MSLSARAILVLFLVSGCGDADRSGERRTWLPTDHQQPAEAEPDVNEPPTPETFARAVAALYSAQCASCHGIEGRGDGPDAPEGGMADFTTSEYQDGQTDAQIADLIRVGRGEMPAYGGQLNDRGINALVGHIRGLRGEDGGP